MFSREIYQNIAETLQRYEKFLILLPKYPSGNVISSGIALLLVLKRLKKKVVIVSDAFHLPRKYAFLPHITEISSVLENPKKFVILIDGRENKLENFSYEIKDGVLNIYLTPKERPIEERSIRLLPEEYTSDAAIALGVTDMRSLGEIGNIFQTHFFELPLINIDSNIGNTQHEAKNLLHEGNATSEILFSLFENLNPKLITPDVATALLTGITSAYHARSNESDTSFLSIASTLRDQYSARHEEVYGQLFAKDAAKVKLLGNILSHLERDDVHEIVWCDLDQSIETKDEFIVSDLPEIWDEILRHFPKTKAAFFIAPLDNKNGGEAYIMASHDIHLHDALQEFHPEGSSEIATFTFENTSLNEIRERLLAAVKTYQTGEKTSQHGHSDPTPIL
jgi:nanoRNase/pAp phosphatase (c-di-AMP/oligoRNAs hydrolase)